jgi:hypothetical protein
MIALIVVLRVLALICFIAAAVELPQGRINWVGAGLALWMLSIISVA